MKKINISTLLIILLVAFLLTSLGFLGKVYWEVYGEFGWKAELRARTCHLAVRDAEADFNKGKRILFKVQGYNSIQKCSGEKKGDFEVWLILYYPTLGKAHMYSQEQYVEFYNRRMNYMYAHPKLQTNIESSNKPPSENPTPPDS